MKKWFIVLLLLFVFLAANAQEKSENNRNLTIKFPLSSLAGDIYAESMGIGFGLEKMIKPSISVSQEIGYIFHVNQVSIFSEDVDNINGLKFTTEIRKYLNKKEIPESGFFATLEMKNIFTKSKQESGTIDENEITRYRGVITANLGVLFYLDKYKKSKFTLELLGGGGLGFINASSSVNAESMNIKTNYNTKQGFYPCLNLDFKIGYILK